jgi:hypothetical protein
MSDERHIVISSPILYDDKSDRNSLALTAPLLLLASQLGVF